MLCPPPQSCFFNRGFSQVSSPSSLSCCLLQSSDLAGGYSFSVYKPKMCFPQSPNKVRTAPCSQQQSSSRVWYFAGVCVCLLVSVCVCVGGGSYSPSNHLLLQLRKKKSRDKGSVCARVCLRVSCSVSPTSSWLCHGRLPLFLFQSIMVLRERLQFAFPFLSLLCSALGL